MTVSAAPLTTIRYERDRHGTLFAVEVVSARDWDDGFLDPPARAVADVRVVVLGGRSDAPEALPGWLRVERVALRAAEGVPAYSTAVDPSPAESLWVSSPYCGPRGAALAEFVRAAAAAVRTPEPVPSELARCERVLRAYAADSNVLAPFATLDRLALERWVQRWFRDPDTLAAEVLLERLDLVAPEAAALLRFLREAEVDAAAPEHLELAMDRLALLEQASPWLPFEGGSLAGGLAAAKAWQRRYRSAYDAHYRRLREEAGAALTRLDAVEPAAHALRLLNEITALGPPVGCGALRLLVRARVTIEALPAVPSTASPRTADVTLGAPWPAVSDAEQAAVDVRAALEVQRRRLAVRAAHLVLDREEVPALDRLLQALTAADIDGIERILDDRLAAHIDGLLSV